MNIRNRLYRLQLRSVRSFQSLQHTQQSQQRLYQKQLHSIQATLQLMYTAFVPFQLIHLQKHNLQMQQIYIDLINAKGKNLKIRARDIKKVYELLSENKTAEITFGRIYQVEENERREREEIVWGQKEGGKTRDILVMTFNKTFPKFPQTQPSLQKLHSEQPPSPSLTQKPQQNHSPNNQYIHLLQLTYRRLYSRLLQQLTKKLTYYILNKRSLYQLILSSISQIVRKLQIIIRRINDLRDTKMLLDVIKLIYQENLVIEERIYGALVNEGHVVSIEEFFRINGEMMEEQRNANRKSSRVSLAQLSVISSKESQRQQDQETVKIISSKFYNHNKSKRVEKASKCKVKVSKKPKSNHKNLWQSRAQDQQTIPKPQTQQKQEKNITHIQRMHKEIESKYIAVLDKIGELVVNNQSSINIEIDTPKNMIDDQQLQIDNEKINSLEEIIVEVERRVSPVEKWRRQNDKKKTTIKKSPDTFQYFSSDFKKIINQLDEKKGRKLQMNTSPIHSPPSQQTQTVYFEKFTNETISLKNPLNVARLLGKRFKTISGGSHITYISNSRRSRKMARQNTHIHQLLKIYQQNQKEKENCGVDVRFDSSNVSDEQEENGMFKRTCVKVGFKQRDGGKRMTTVVISERKGGRSVKEVDQSERKFEYNADEDQVLPIVREPFGDMGDIAKIQENKGKNVRFRNSSTEQKASRHSPQLDQSQHNNQASLHTVNKTSPSKPSPTHKKPIHSNNSLSNSPKHSKAQQFSSSRLYKIYNEFTNPLTTKYGYYNDQNYRSLRDSLKVCEANTLKFKKGILKRDDEMQVGKDVAFGVDQKGLVMSGEKKERKKKAAELLGANWKQLNDIKENRSGGQIVSKGIKTFKPLGSSTKSNHNKISKASLAPQLIRNQQTLSPTSKLCPIFPTSFLKPAHKSHSFFPHKYITQTATTQAMETSLASNFCLESSRFLSQEKLNNQNDVGKLVEKCMEQQNTLQIRDKKIQRNCQFIFKTQPVSMMQSLRSTPRNSVRQRQQVYSTQRRMNL